MRNLIFFGGIFVALLVAGCQQSNQALRIDIDVFRKNKTEVVEGDTLDSYPVKIKIRNTTDSVVSFWIMDCSYFYSFETNSPKVFFLNDGCDKNIPVFISLQKDNEYKTHGSLCVFRGDTVLMRKQLQVKFAHLSKMSDFRRELLEVTISKEVESRFQHNKGILYCDVHYHW